jgi:hypothetical protein
MSDVRSTGFRFSSIPKSRHFWISLVLFLWVTFTAIVLIVDWNNVSRVDVFRRILQIIIFSMWGFDRLQKYRAGKSVTSSSK